MRSDLICKMAILSSNSPNDTGTRISDMDAQPEKGGSVYLSCRVGTRCRDESTARALMRML